MIFKTSTYEVLMADLPELPSIAPFLRSLTLARPYEQDHWGRAIPGGPDSVKLPTFLQWSMPSLSELDLRGYCVDLSAPMFKSSLCVSSSLR